MPSSRTILACLLALTLAVTPRRAHAQETGVLVLKVTDPEGVPLARAAAKVDGVRRGTTGPDGRVRVQGIAPGWHALKVTLLGRRAVALGMMVPPGGVAELEVGLQPDAIRLPGLAATVPRDKASPHGRPTLAGTGKKFTRDDLDRSKSPTLSGVLRDAPEVELVQGPHGPVLRFRRTFAALRPAPGGGLEPPDCAPEYYVDGIRFAALETPDLFPISEVEDVVLFPGNVPAEYGGVRASCGVVVIRTRGGPAAAPKPRTLRGPGRTEKARPRPLAPKAARVMGKQPAPKHSSHSLSKPGP
ncbi:carboxypeptidase-like regulatory domain-containing protein [Longimicrobium sp.]|uniref:carboxypeptidase-like regulatory domain-containing protein n=1 Tax=Longimicrobium sp. TaxID=2029185 RepID=UPI002D050AB1|nr:carboxypeptidase-like regulatory domain-containing protein [Longimicrobium sp.]HSU15805.1 carboxypeptidase-like regulatory domain-containing protein [Longimicrobium sp.]